MGEFDKILGVSTLLLMALALLLSAYLLTGRREKADVYRISRLVLTLVLTVSGLCGWIYMIYR